MISNQKINVFISSKLCNEYRTIRDNIALKLEGNELFHLFEYNNSPATSLELEDSYMLPLQNSDVVIVLLDNIYGIGDGTKQEVETAVKLDKKMIFILLNKDPNDCCVSDEVQSLMTLDRNYSIIHSFSEMEDAIIKSLYQDVSQRYLSSSSNYLKEKNARRLLFGGDIKKDDLKGAESISKFLSSLEPPFVQKDIKNEDKNVVDLLSTILKLSKFNHDSFNKLKESLLSRIDNSSKGVIEKRFNALEAFLVGDYSSTLAFLNQAKTTFENTSSKVKWLYNDILLDIRNVNAVMGISNYQNLAKAQEDLNKTEEKIQFPYFDRCRFNFYRKIAYDDFEDVTKKALTMSFTGPDKDELLGYLSESFLAALKYASITLLTNFKNAYFDYRWAQYKRGKSVYHYFEMVRLCVVNNDDKKLNKLCNVCFLDESEYNQKYMNNIFDSILTLNEKEKNVAYVMLLKAVGYLMNECQFSIAFIQLQCFVYSINAPDFDGADKIPCLIMAISKNINRIGDRVWVLLEELLKSKTNRYILTNISKLLSSIFNSYLCRQDVTKLSSYIDEFIVNDNRGSMLRVVLNCCYQDPKLISHYQEYFDNSDDIPSVLFNSHFNDGFIPAKVEELCKQIENELLSPRNGISFGGMSNLELLLAFIEIDSSKGAENLPLDDIATLLNRLIFSSFTTIKEKIESIKALIWIFNKEDKKDNFIKIANKVSQNYTSILSLNDDRLFFEGYTKGHLFFALCFMCSTFDFNEENRLVEMIATPFVEEKDLYLITDFVSDSIINSVCSFSDKTKTLLFHFLWRAYFSNNLDVRHSAYFCIRQFIGDKDIGDTVQKGLRDTFNQRDSGERIGIVRNIEKCGDDKYFQDIIKIGKTGCDYELKSFIDKSYNVKKA